MDARASLYDFAELDAPALGVWAATRATDLSLHLDPWRDGVLETLKGLQSHARTVTLAIGARPGA